MKSFQILVILLFLENVLSDNDGICMGSAYELNVCLEKKEEMEEGYCCYLTGISKDDETKVNQCLELNQDAYDEIDNTVKYYKTYYDDLRINCMSYSLNISILFLILKILLLN